MNAHVRLWALLLALVAITLSMMGQTISSSLKGTLVDPVGGVVPHAKVSLTNEATRATLEVTSTAEGSFVFPNVLAGSYTLRAEATGFQSLEIKNIMVSASETRALGGLTLQLGDVRQTVSVTAQGAPVQLASSERSAVITDKQIQDILVRGRDFFALISVAPGVVDTAARRETTSPSASAGIHINGGRQNQKNLTIDGITDLDTGSSQTVHFEPNMDAIAEIKVLASNYQAEFGRNSGGVISVITKSGSRNFHGTAYDFYRHESLNANSFFNNRAGSNPDGTPKVPKNPYRYRISGFSVGGPLYVPRKFNTAKSKFFFFFSQEYVGTKKDYGTKYFNMPTDLERNGDFSRSFDSSGALIRVIDAQTGQQFPGNTIPANRINKLGQAILNFFPKPNYVETGDPRQFYNRNYKTAYSGHYPKRDDVIRIDASLKSNLQVFWRYAKDTDEQLDPTLNGSYFLTPSRSGKPGKGQTVHITKGLSPTLVNEFVFGKSRNDIYWEPVDKAVVDRSRMGNPPLWFNHTNPNMDYIPTVQFGGQPSNTPAASVSGPYRNWNDIFSFLDNVGKVWGPHSLKAGIYIERTGKVQLGTGYYRGLFNFNRNPNNPFDSGHSFANALLGNFNYYAETTDPADSDWWFWNVEWYVQDNWRVGRRLTLDVGLRFYHLPPTEDLNRKTATFDPRYYDPAKVPVLYVPAIDPVSKRRVAQDPISRVYAPAPLIGLFVPGSGDYGNGMKVGGKDGYPPGLFTTAWLTLGPRFGFAYDLFGDGKTAIRGGFGMFKDRPQGNPSFTGNINPPIVYAAAQYYGNLDTYAQSGGAIGPSELNPVLGDIKLASTMNFSLGVQRHIWKTTIDVAYVGGLSRHLIVRRNMNPIPMYARFDLPKNQDPTQPGSPLPDDFLRPYRGLSSITLWDFAGTSNYNALQLSASRRYTRGLQLGVAYTRSKTLGVAPDDYTAVSPYFAPRQRNYGPLAYDRPNMFGVNYIYDLPKMGTKTGFKPTGWVLDNWQISGITAFATGAPFTVGAGTQDSADITGSQEGARVTVIGNPKLSKSERTFYRFFNTGAFARTPVRNFGNGGVNYLYGPGANNWDLAISKRIPLHGEGRYIQFRTEMFNAWNHTQFSTVGAAPAFATFANGAKPTDPNFGVITGAGDPRLIQLSLKFYF